MDGCEVWGVARTMDGWMVGGCGAVCGVRLGRWMVGGSGAVWWLAWMADGCVVG